LGVGIATNRYILGMNWVLASTQLQIHFQNCGDNDVDTVGNYLTLAPTIQTNGAITWDWGSNGIPDKYIPNE
ncbi:MAG: hypothetical protein GTO24_26720, partial [candidate division Zixibacteria bacterium]|nr:hypothetical protein [candidate division Zixibacteria bacterium]